MSVFAGSLSNLVVANTDAELRALKHDIQCLSNDLGLPYGSIGSLGQALYKQNNTLELIINKLDILSRQVAELKFTGKAPAPVTNSAPVATKSKSPTMPATAAHSEPVNNSCNAQLAELVELLAPNN